MQCDVMAHASAKLLARFTILNRRRQISRHNGNRTQIDAVFAVYTTDENRIVLKTLHFWQCFQIDPVSATVSVGVV